MRVRVAIVCLVALPLTTADLAVKAALPTDPLLYHRRSAEWALLSALLVAAAVIAAARLPSRLFAAGAGLLAAGVLGNLVSAWHDGGLVPNPFVAGGIAFNLADVVFVAALAVEAVAGMRLAARYRHLLPTSTIPVRLARRVRARRAGRA